MFRAPVRDRDGDRDREEAHTKLLQHAALLTDVLEGILAGDWSPDNPANNFGRTSRVEDAVTRAWHCLAELAPEFSAARIKDRKRTLPWDARPSEIYSAAMSTGLDPKEFRFRGPASAEEHARQMGRLMARLAG